MIEPVVFDASVLIDLRVGKLLDRIAALRWERHVADVMARDEITSVIGACPDLSVHRSGLSSDELAEALGIQREMPAISFYDACAFVLARRIGACLLTGDRDLRAYAGRRRLSFHGTLYCLERLEAIGTPPSVLHAALDAIATHGRTRLPMREVTRALARYRSTSDDAAPVGIMQVA